MAADVQTKILELFEKHQAAGSEYDEFLDQVEIELGICFSIKDREADYSLQTLVGRALHLKQFPRGSLRSLENRLKMGSGCVPIIMAVDYFLIVFAISLRDYGWALIATAIAVAAAVNIGGAVIARRLMAHDRKLLTRIKGG